MSEERLSRRRMLKRIGTGAAVAWTAPAIVSLTARPAFAQGRGACAPTPWRAAAPASSPSAEILVRRAQTAGRESSASRLAAVTTPAPPYAPGAPGRTAAAGPGQEPRLEKNPSRRIRPRPLLHRERGPDRLRSPGR